MKSEEKRERDREEGWRSAPCRWYLFMRTCSHMSSLSAISNDVMSLIYYLPPLLLFFFLSCTGPGHLRGEGGEAHSGTDHPARRLGRVSHHRGASSSRSVSPLQSASLPPTTCMSPYLLASHVICMPCLSYALPAAFLACHITFLSCCTLVYAAYCYVLPFTVIAALSYDCCCTTACITGL